jgi:hypothetical protein
LVANDVFQGVHVRFFMILITGLALCCSATFALAKAPSTLQAQALTPQAMPSLPPLAVQVKYNIRWGAFTLGRVWLSIDETADHYRMSLDVKTSGLASLFAKTRGFLFAQGDKNPQTDYIPRLYDYWSKARGKSSVVIHYDKQGKLLTRVRIPPDDPRWRPEIPLDALGRSTDPITAFLRLRQIAAQNPDRANTPSKVLAYEGKKLAEFALRSVFIGKKQIHGEMIRVEGMILSRRPIKGYTPKEKKKYAEKGDPVTHIYFSRNQLFLPLEIDVKVALGAIKLVMDEDSLPQILSTQP